MKKLLGLLAVSAMALFASADQFGYVQVAIWSPGELPSPEYRIDGFRLALFYGQSQNFRGLDISPMMTRTRGKFTGVGLTGVSLVEQSYTGWQFGLFSTYTAETFTGLQQSIFANVTDGKVRGVQLGCLANVADTLCGVQLPAIYNGADAANGIQLGLWNNSNEDMNGLQVGLVNVATDLDGVQLGLINVNFGGVIPVFPFVNAGW